MTFKIEKGIPAPAAKTSRRWPFADMKVGDSVVIPAEKVMAARNTACMFGKNRGWKFTVRLQEDGTARCWRLS